MAYHNTFFVSTKNGTLHLVRTSYTVRDDTSPRCFLSKVAVAAQPFIHFEIDCRAPFGGSHDPCRSAGHNPLTGPVVCPFSIRTSIAFHLAPKILGTNGVPSTRHDGLVDWIDESALQRHRFQSSSRRNTTRHDNTDEK